MLLRKLFKFDFITVQMPIIFIILASNLYIVYLTHFVLFAVTILSLISTDNQIKSNLTNSTICENFDLKLIRLSVNTFRTFLFLITSACILAVDFPHFSIDYMKSHGFGFGLMDIGVGFFILCHSMRYLRNMKNEM